MRLSIPTIPRLLATAQPTPPTPPAQAIEVVANFLARGNVTIITGAGVSVDSGIRAYRGENGQYMNPNYKPIFYHEIVGETQKGFEFRQRYWLRSYLGYPTVRDALPNTTHCALAALQYASVVPRLITQNVDGLHHKAISHVWDRTKMHSNILELHGTLRQVQCKYGHEVDRDVFQDLISAANPQWSGYTEELQRNGRKPKSNPDGDVALEGVSYDDFVVPPCPECLLQSQHNTNMKPHLVFFGESIPEKRKERSFQDIEEGSRLLIIGSTLSTNSAFRLVKHALELQMPVLHLNIGPSRADGLPGMEKVDIASGTIIRQVVRAVLGASVAQDSVIEELLRSGVVVKVPSTDDSDHDNSTRLDIDTEQGRS